MRGTKSPFASFREAKGYSMRSLAKALRLKSPATVAGWDRGAIPAGDKLIELSGLFGTTPDYVLRLIEQSKPDKAKVA